MSKKGSPAWKAGKKRKHKRWLKKHPEKIIASLKRWVKECPDSQEAKKQLKIHREEYPHLL